MSSAAVQPESESDSKTQILRGGAGNVDKIRDILFGNQMRDYEARFSRLEESLPPGPWKRGRDRSRWFTHDISHDIPTGMAGATIPLR